MEAEEEEVRGAARPVHRLGQLLDLRVREAHEVRAAHAHGICGGGKVSQHMPLNYVLAVCVRVPVYVCPW